MQSTSFTMNHKVQFIFAGILSILAQGFLFQPVKLSGYFTIPEWGPSAVGTTLFAAAGIRVVFLIRAQKIGWRGNAHFVFNQAAVVIGTLLLFGTSASNTRLGGFLLTSLITTLTIYGIIANTSHITRAYKDSESGKEKEKIRIPAPLHNADGLKEQAAMATQKLAVEKHRSTQLTYLLELSQQLEVELEPPVAAQMAINTLEHAVSCGFASLMTYDADRKEFIVLASGGKMISIIPPGHRQDSTSGLHGRVLRQKKTISVNDTTLDPDFVRINNENTRSTIIVPIISYGYVNSILEVRSEKPHAFNNMDIMIVEGVASVLTRAWERANHNQRLRELIQSGISLTTQFDPQAAVQEIAILARKAFEARFVFVTLLDQQGNFSRIAHAGEAPKLLVSMNEDSSKEPLLQGALNASKPFRVRDLRKYASNKVLEIDHPNLRCALAIPIRLHRLSIGAIIAFGKENGLFFSENDESLADLLAAQAAASVESSWLYQELRNTLNITSMLRQLSEDVIMTEEVGKAAETIARAAYKATNAAETGIVLITPDGEIQAEVELDANGFHTRRDHPMDIIHQAIQMKQSIFISEEQGLLVCYPLLIRTRPVGALWISMPESRGQNFANIQMMANQGAVSLERVNLLAESRRQAKEIEAAYAELEETYDQTLKALMSALDARDRETEGHSMRVSRMACLLGEKVGLNDEQLKTLKRGSLLHDIGKIGISDIILHKPGRLTDAEWKIMRMHPEIGSRIVERIPFLQESMSVVRYHHERWDGSGYPLGIKGRDIPINARIFAVVDVFDALTSKRSYRKKSSPDEAVQYLREQSGVLFDGDIVEALSRLPYSEFIEGGPIV